MSLAKINPTHTKAWEKLKVYFEKTATTTLQEQFVNAPDRASKMRIKWEDFYVDYSKNRIDPEGMALLVELAKECGLEKSMRSYFGGQPINETEGRAVLHTALRAPAKAQVFVDGKNIIPEVYAVREKIRAFSEAVINGQHQGKTGQPFTDIVNIGIGGSDLGPAMVTEALAFYKNHLNVHFVSNVDGDHLHQSLKDLNPETTLFVVVSKTFTTQETLTNALSAKKWLCDALGADAASHHFAAVSTNLPNIEAFGIDPQKVFPMNDWVGGRFSLWSAVGLSIALAVGPDHFEKLLDGAGAMDAHFKEASFDQNIPVVLALLSVWYNNFWGAESHAIIPYAQALNAFAAYLQQGIMESNGKSTDRNGKAIAYQTGNIIWGAPGTNAQHAFFQLIHQGTKLIPADFIGFKKSLYNDKDHHQKLMANFFAQTEALMKGKSESEVRHELEVKGMDKEMIEQLLPFKIFAGNKPTNTLLIEKLTPYNLGALIAIYEHKIFVEGVIWNIFSYDQWGVELGKVLANNILNDLESGQVDKHDASTTSLLQQFMNT